MSIISASITISPAAGTVQATTSTAGSTSISITGSGFKGNEAFTVYFDTIAFPAATVGLLKTNNNGGIILYTGSTTSPLRIPTTSTTAGIHTIAVMTASGGYASFSFTINPRIALTPTALRAGDKVTIAGTGFAATSTQTLTLNGTLAQWYDTTLSPPQLVTTAPTTGATGDLSASKGTVIPSTTAPGYVTVKVTDAAGNYAEANLTILASPSIVLSAGQVVPGVTVGIAGDGFSPGTARTTSAQILSGTTVINIPTLSAATQTVGSTGKFGNASAEVFSTAFPITFTVPTGLTAGNYTISFTLGVLAGPPAIPAETASATFVILGAPTAVASPTSIASGGNVTLTVVGLTGIQLATLGTTNLVVAGVQQTTGTPAVPVFGSVAVENRGANAYNLTTWFSAPTNVPAGSYSLVLSDALGFSATTVITITPKITLSTLSGIKGTPVAITGTGFTSASTFTVTFNGVSATNTAGLTTTATGGLTSIIINVPPIATANNTITVTDAAGQSASATFALTTPTLTIVLSAGAVGSTVQLIGSGYSASAVFVQVGTTVVTTAPTLVAGPSFICFVIIPQGTPNGNTTITATDSQNNVASAAFVVGGGQGTGYTINQAALSSTAQTVNPSTGQTQTSFARGSQVKFTFVLGTTVGAANVMWRITLQQPDLGVYNIVGTTASVSTAPNTIPYTQLLPSGIQTGTWTATIQVYAQDGVTALAVTTVSFTVT